MEKFLILLSTFEPLSESFTIALKERIVRSSRPKGHRLLEAAQVSNSMYFLKRGFAVSFHHIKKSKHVEELFKEGSLIISSRSFLQRLPAQESIELLEAGELFILSYDSVMWLSQHFSEAKSLYLLAMIARIENSREQTLDLQLLDAHERYKKFKINYPSAFRLLPLKQIAGYLGMAAQTIGRLRREDDDSHPLRRKKRNS